MPISNIAFSRVKEYLDGIADKANNDVETSPHGRFWRTSYKEFVDGVVPLVKCNGNPIPIIDKGDPANSPLLLILTSADGWCGRAQMPDGGPVITDADYAITLLDKTIVSGKQIQEDLTAWLKGGFPEL